FERDTQALQRGYVFGAPGAEAQLEANKRAFFDEFVTRPAFKSQYDSMSNADFVSALLANANLTPTIGNLHVSRLTASQVVLTPQQMGYLVNGQLYVDVHTQNNPEGEIRAQIAPTLFRGDVLRAALDQGILTRAQVLRVVAEFVEFGRAEFRRAFVLMEYFG